MEKRKFEETSSAAKRTRQQTALTNNQGPSPILALPVELVYRILDHLDDFTILCSTRNVCTRWNMITDTYHRYQVSFSVVMEQKCASRLTICRCCDDTQKLFGKPLPLVH